jgi:thiosulfate/3-mercaptopyruvate sulfurtransferase
MKALAAGSLLAISTVFPAAAFDSPLIDPAGLQQVLAGDSIQIIDIRAPEGEGGYASGHIEGAVSAPYPLFRGPAENPGQLPDLATLEGTVESLGLEPDQPVVVTYQGASISDFGAAARVYWTLKSLGFEELAILNGGIEAWSEAGLALSTDAVTPVPSTLDLSWNGTWTATTDEVRAIVDGEAEARLVDARPESFWKGEQAHPAAARPGTLPQSEYFVHSSWFSSGPAIIDAAAAADLAQEAGLEGPLVSFCNTGHWAATNWFAMSELAGLDARLYPESMVGWSNAGFDMANVPGRLQTLIRQITD